MGRNYFDYDLFNLENGIYLGTAFNSTEIVVGEPLGIPKGLLEKRNPKRECLCSVVKIEPDTKEEGTYRVYVKPVESWQFGMSPEDCFKDWRIDRSGEDSRFKQE